MHLRDDGRGPPCLAKELGFTVFDSGETSDSCFRCEWIRQLCSFPCFILSL